MMNNVSRPYVQLCGLASLAVVLCCGGPARSQAAPEAHQPLPVSLRLTPQSMSYQRNASFDENGKVQNDYSSLNLNMRVDYASEHAVTAYELVSVEPMETTRGQTLRPEVRKYRREIDPNNQQSQFNLGIQVSNPGEASGHIRSLRGVLRMHYAAGAKLRVKLGPYAEVVGKRAKVEGLTPGVWLAVRKQDDQVRIEMPGTLFPQLAGIRFFKKDGVELPAQGWGSSTSGATVYRAFRVTVPEDGYVEVDFWSSVETIDVPFELLDFPLPSQQNEAAFEVAMR